MKKLTAAAKVRNGPCESCINQILQKHGIQRQAYHVERGCFCGESHPQGLKTCPHPWDDVRTSCRHFSSLFAGISTQKQALSNIATKIWWARMLLAQQYSVQAWPSATKIWLSLTAEFDFFQTFMVAARRKVVDRRLGRVIPMLHLWEDYVLACMHAKVWCWARPPRRAREGRNPSWDEYPDQDLQQQTFRTNLIALRLSFRTTALPLCYNTTPTLLSLPHDTGSSAFTLFNRCHGLSPFSHALIITSLRSPYCHAGQNDSSSRSTR